MYRIINIYIVNILKLIDSCNISILLILIRYIIGVISYFENCDSTIGFLSIAPHLVIALPTLQ